MISDEMIDKAKAQIKSDTIDYSSTNDSIRVAYHWLDAQNTIKGSCSKALDLKRLIREWAGLFVTTLDVELAAFLHPKIKVKYSKFNISARLTEPSLERLKDIKAANSHPGYRDDYDPTCYTYQEKYLK